MTSASIDDLLRYEEEPAGSSGRTGRSSRATILRILQLTVLITIGITVLLRLAGVAVPIILVAGGVLALMTLRGLLRLVAPPGRRPARAVVGELDTGDGTYQWPPPDAMRRAVGHWEQRLSRYADAPSTFTDRLQPMLRDLADERLRQGHGVTITGDPARARALLGEPAWTVLTGAYRRGPSLRDVARAVATLEELVAAPATGTGNGTTAAAGAAPGVPPLPPARRSEAIA